MVTYSPSDISFGHQEVWKKKIYWAASFVANSCWQGCVSVGSVFGILIVAGVMFCPKQIVNLRARLLRHNYKYQRVKLEDDPEEADVSVELSNSTGVVEDGSPNSLLKRATKMSV